MDHVQHHRIQRNHVRNLDHRHILKIQNHEVLHQQMEGLQRNDEHRDQLVVLQKKHQDLGVDHAVHRSIHVAQDLEVDQENQEVDQENQEVGQENLEADLDRQLDREDQRNHVADRLDRIQDLENLEVVQGDHNQLKEEIGPVAYQDREVFLDLEVDHVSQDGPTVVQIGQEAVQKRDRKVVPQPVRAAERLDNLEADQVALTQMHDLAVDLVQMLTRKNRKDQEML